MSEKCGIAWGDGLLQINNRGEGNMLLRRKRDLRWLVNMVAMFRCVYAEEAGELGCWGNRGGAGDHRAALAGSRLVLILSDLLTLVIRNFVKCFGMIMADEKQVWRLSLLSFYLYRKDAYFLQKRIPPLSSYHCLS